MSLEEPVVVLDDDEDEDDIQILETETSRVTGPVQAVKQYVTERRPKNQLPLSANGYTRPSTPYPKLITLALITFPNKRGTVRQICEAIPNHQPYFKYCPNVWQTSVAFALRSRKKFFSKFGLGGNYEQIWGLNPSYERIMIIKWVPKYMRLKYCSEIELSVDCPTSATSSSVTTFSPLVVNSQSLRPQSPVFVSSGKSEMVNYEALIPETNLEEETTSPVDHPEYVLEDPEGQPANEQCNTEQPFVPLEPTVSVSENSTSTLPNPNGQSVVKPGAQENSFHNDVFREITTYKNLFIHDFALGNLKLKQICNEEIKYRYDFLREHKHVTKFRLHCTVCNRHLGTSVLNMKPNVRFHSILAVLVCTDCYLSTSHSKFQSCLWCGKADGMKCVCKSCTSIFCVLCLRRNYGNEWYQRMSLNLKCLLCEPKHMWTHRAIAYYLYRHYMNYKKQKVHYPPNKISTFYHSDLSTCCKTNAETSSPTSGTSQTFVIDSPAPNQIYLTTPPEVSSVTLNTGTQYIHNVYPNKNYVVVQPPTQDGNAVTTSTLSRTSYPSLSDLLDTSPTTSSSTPQKGTASNVQSKMWNSHSHEKNITSIGQENTLERSSRLSDPQIIQTNESETSDINLNFIVRPAVPEENIILPDKDCDMIQVPNENFFNVPSQQPVEMILPSPEPVKSEALTIRQKIDKPMPMSKKQSLLRTVLMSESIESMKRHIMNSETEGNPNFNSETTNKESENAPIELSVPSKSTGDIEGNEEPILKSIIETATERLLELKKKQNATLSCLRYTQVRDDPQQDNVHEQTLKSTSEIPKIKIRELKELQDQSMVISEQSNGETLNGSAEVQESNTTENSSLMVLSTEEINVMTLKKGIIEACQTLVSTQKKLRELATVISSNLLYNKEKAKDLVHQFQGILNACQVKFDGIDNTVKQEFCNVMNDTNMDSLFIQNSSIESTNNKTTKGLLRKRRKRKPRMHDKQKKYRKVAEQSAFNDMEDNEVQHSDFVDSNLSNTSLSNSMSNENGASVNQQQIKLKNIRPKKKRCIWNDKKKKREMLNRRQSIVFNKDGSVMKRRGRQSNSCRLDSVLPMRISGRKHPSSEQYLSQLISSQCDRPVNLYSSLIRPCSVLLHRLDQRIVELLKMRAAKVLN